MNGHMYFRNVLGSIAPVDPPTVEQTVACVGYAFKKWRVHRRCLISPSGGIIHHQSPHVCNEKWARPKKLTEVTIFCSDGSDRSTRLVLDVFSDQKKILCHRCGNPHSFCFFLVHVKGWRSSSERIEEGITMMMIGKEREFSWLLETATSCA